MPQYLIGFSKSTNDHMFKRKKKKSELLEHFDAMGEKFLSKIITSDETWVHNFETKMKRQSTE